MDGWQRPTERGRRRAQQLASRLGRELRVVRLTAGMTQEQVATVARLGQSTVSRLELGNVLTSLDAACRVAATVGHELGLGVYPAAGTRLRDRGQLGSAQALLADLHPSWRPTLEVPVGGARDRRAIDMVLDHPNELIAVEIERWLVDFQAQLRSLQLKRDAFAARTDRPVRLVLAIRDTPRNRRAIRPHREVIRRAGFAGSAAVRRALRHGTPLGADGILWVQINETALIHPADPAGHPHAG